MATRSAAAARSARATRSRSWSDGGVRDLDTWRGRWGSRYRRSARAAGNIVGSRDSGLPGPGTARTLVPPSSRDQYPQRRDDDEHAADDRRQLSLLPLLDALAQLDGADEDGGHHRRLGAGEGGAGTAVLDVL